MTAGYSAMAAQRPAPSAAASSSFPSRFNQPQRSYSLPSPVTATHPTASSSQHHAPRLHTDAAGYLIPSDDQDGSVEPETPSSSDASRDDPEKHGATSSVNGGTHKGKGKQSRFVRAKEFYRMLDEHPEVVEYETAPWIAKPAAESEDPEVRTPWLKDEEGATEWLSLFYGEPRP